MIQWYNEIQYSNKREQTIATCNMCDYYLKSWMKGLRHKKIQYESFHVYEVQKQAKLTYII